MSKLLKIQEADGPDFGPF